MPTKFTLPEKEITFEIDVTGDKTNERYKGSFTYKRLNLGEARRARCEKARLMESLPNLDAETVFICEMISWLNQGLKSAPPWWSDPWELYDYNIITEIYEKVLDFENSFVDKIKDMGLSTEPIEQKNVEGEEENEQGLVVEPDEDE